MRRPPHLVTAHLEQERLVTLARRLAVATAAGAVSWSIQEPELFSRGSAEGTVTVASRDRDGDPPYELVVYNVEGEKLDELSSALLDDDEPAPWNEALAELHRVAGRNALHADDVIEALIAALPTNAGEAERQALP